MKQLRLAAFAAAVLLAACTSSPTNSTRSDATAPSFDGGAGLGSGNYVAEGGPGTIGGGTENQTTASDSTENQRGGATLGSGN